MISNCIHLLMVLAIFNPLCCCTAAAVFGVEDAEMAQAMHSCCKSQSQDVSESGSSDSGHDPEDCPHKAVKDYQASQLKDVNAKQDFVTYIPALIAVLEFIWVEPVAQPSHTVSLATASLAPPVPLSQVYCIYRI